MEIKNDVPDSVSTHSRPKAAGGFQNARKQRFFRFNTQPPEGGWGGGGSSAACGVGFNTQPPKGGWGPTRDLED